MSRIKYYSYVSETKVNMLYSQIPQNIKGNLEAEAKLKLPIAEISFSKKQMPDNLYVRLGIVIDYLEKESVIGNI